jgi:hypothetical protein
MAAFKVRGRFFIKLALPGGGSFAVESDPKRSLTIQEIVSQLKHYAEFIEKHFPAPQAQSPSASELGSGSEVPTRPEGKAKCSEPKVAQMPQASGQ